MSFLSKVDIIKFVIAYCAIYLVVSPIGISHICFIVGFLIVIFNLTRRPTDSSILWIFVFFIFVFIQLSIGASWKAMLNNVSSMMMYIIVIDLLKRTSKRRIFFISYIFIKVTTIILCIECLFRLLLSVPHGISLYNLKFNSFMFFDTNFCGLVILVVLCFIRYLIKFEHQLYLKKYIFINFILLLLTLSRAAILGYIFFEFLFYRINTERWKTQLFKRLTLLFFILVILGSILVKIALTDDSFKSKLYIFNLVSENITIISKIIIWGIGYEHGQQFLGIYPHNFFLLYIIETGLVGLSLKISFIFYCLYRTKWRGLFIILPFLIPIQSATGYATHYLYAVLGILTALQNYSHVTKIYYAKKDISLYGNP